MAEGGEIIIVRRVAEEDHAHHGGVWKIALADFMTTLMALFLVLWLIKASNEETKTSIANYFNPISLSDAMPTRKGLADPKPPALAEPSQGRPAANPEAGHPSADPVGGHVTVDPVPGHPTSDPVPGKAPSGSEAMQDKAGVLPPGSVARERELFQDPYSVLATLAAETEPDKPQSATIGELGEPGRRGGDAPRDPFDPLYWQVTTLSPAKADRPASAGITPPPEQTTPDARSAGVTEAKETAGKAALGKATEGKAGATTNAEIKASAEKAGEVKTGDVKATEASANRIGQGPDTAAGQAALKAEIAKIFPPTAPGPHVEVQGTPEGLLINVTDDLNFSMFAVGSAEPRPEMVRAMERLAKVLAARPGRIVVRGHTDSRPFRSEVYDNWRLSTARAHMASYMLTRAGIAESRIWRIEGAADRTPRNTADSKAPENRRIEILLQGAPG
ncbi:chemotaxis protein MotB [Methylobacterium phyllostachyos]|uniref:Chemotaxis protein MotB n=1 Tax=Methylobacterium phyllostachyos TaxID=582672 RepID=A0A1H0B7N6_9HYPH|nr:flagellar motor protein MotB [Methylobacterium phyllostachyos]SDN41353.1 chemotaxis protein MotB [Methylobacterium phyllostachyos]